MPVYLSVLFTIVIVAYENNVGCYEMIIRRLSQHIHNQNWFAVVVDLLIGVCLGLHAEKWSQAQQDKQKVDFLLKILLLIFPLANKSLPGVYKEMNAASK